MTFRTKRRTYWILFSISVAAFAAGAVFALGLLVRKDLVIFLIERGVYRIHDFAGLRIPSQVLSLLSPLAAGAFSIVMGGFILKTFRKTESSEIFFFAFWLCSLSFESLRLLHAFLALSGARDSILAFIDKCYMGTKFLGVVSIFVSGLYASGMRSERQFTILSLAITISVAMAMSLPVNTGIWGRNLVFTIGYSRLIAGFTIAAMAMTTANCLIAVRTRGEKSFFHVAGGLAGAVAGAFLLVSDLSPGAFLAGVILISGGSLLFINKLHAFYLWQ